MGVLIKVNDDYAIRSDSRSWIVAKRRGRKGAEAWEPISWYQTLAVLRAELVARLDRECGAETPEELIAAHLRHDGLLSKVLDGVIDTLEPGGPGQGDGGGGRCREIMPQDSRRTSVHRSQAPPEFSEASPSRVAES